MLHLHRCRAGYWSTEARGQDDARAGCRRLRRRPNTRTDNRPTALATRSQYRSSVARSGARISCGTSISMPSTIARKSSRFRPNLLDRADVISQPWRRIALDRARRYRRAIAAGPRAAPAVALRNRRYHRPGGKSCRSGTSPRAARAAECASPHKTNCRTPMRHSSEWLPQRLNVMRPPPVWTHAPGRSPVG